MIRILLLAGALASQAVMAAPSLRVPPGEWTVRMIPAPHVGDPLLRVDISPQFRWPEPRSGQPIRYQVLLQRPGRPPAAMGWITSDERFLIVGLGGFPASDLVTTPEQDARRREARDKERDALLGALGNEGAPVPRSAAATIATLISRYAADENWRADERTAYLRYRIALRPFAGERAVARQESAKAPQPPKYKWGQVVNDDKDACNGKKPEDCAREKLTKFKDRVCDAKKADQAPRFPKECDALRRMLAKTPPEPTIECEIPGGKGVTGGVTDTDGSIRLNGEELLKDPCWDGIVFHELSHSLEYDDAAKYPNMRKLRDAEKRLEKARADLAAATTDAGRKDAAARAARAMLDINSVEKEAGDESLQTECNALFAILDNADFFGYPGDGLACVKADIKNMMGELSEIRHQFNLPMSVPAGPLCKCYEKMSAYVSAHADVSQNFANDQFAPERPGMSTGQALDALTKLYCAKP